MLCSCRSVAGTKGSRHTAVTASPPPPPPPPPPHTPPHHHHHLLSQQQQQLVYAKTTDFTSSSSSSSSPPPPPRKTATAVVTYIPESGRSLAKLQWTKTLLAITIQASPYNIQLNYKGGKTPPALKSTPGRKTNSGQTATGNKSTDDIQHWR